MDRKTIYPTIDKKLYEEFKELAERLNMPVNVLLEEAMKLILSNNKKQ